MTAYNKGSTDYYGWIKSDRNGNEYEDVQGRGFDYVGYIRLLETKTIMHRLKTVIGNEDVVEDFYPSDFTMMNIGNVADKGFDINSNNYKCFTQIVQWSADEYLSSKQPLILKHLYLGWDDLPTCGTCFKYQNIVFDTKKYPNFKSTYGGTFNMKLQPNPTKQLSGQIAFIKKYVEHSAELSAALAIGASAVVNGYISEDIESPNIIVHFMGDSSTGKTTAAQLAASVACYPSLQANSLMMSWHGTENAIISRVKGNYGEPVIFDELSKFQGKNLSNLVYSLSDGREKDRCNKTGDVKASSKYDCWETTIISTGETSLIGRCSQNTGLATRVIELNWQFTNSAQEADDIKAGVKKYYGYIAPYLAQCMLRMNKTDIIAIHKKYQSQYATKSQAKGLEMRIATNIAVILTAAELLNTHFKLTLNIPAMIDLFLQAEDTSTSKETLAVRAYNYLVDKITMNKHHFITDDYNYDFKVDAPSEEAPVKNTELWGKIETKKDADVTEISIIYEKFVSFLREGNFESDKVILKALKAEGYLNAEEGKYYRKRKISINDKMSSKVVVLVVTDDSEEAVAIQEKLKRLDDELVRLKTLQYDKSVSDKMEACKCAKAILNGKEPKAVFRNRKCAEKYIGTQEDNSNYPMPMWLYSDSDDESDLSENETESANITDVGGEKLPDFIYEKDEETDDVVVAKANDDISDEADDDSIEDFDFEEGCD